MTKYIHIIILFLVLSFSGLAQVSEIEEDINWHKLMMEENINGISHEYLYFDGAYTDVNTGLPLFTHSINISSIDSKILAEFTNTVYEPFEIKEQQYLTGLGFDKTEIEIQSMTSVSKKRPAGIVNFIPIRLNQLTNQYEKLVSFKLTLDIDQQAGVLKSSNRDYAENSVLNSGVWYKIRIQQSGIYKISYSDLESYGINPGSIDPRNIKLFGNAGGMLPEPNDKYRHDDLQENAIQILGEEDGSFDPSDYILFYGQSPHQWQNVLGFFTYHINLYEDFGFYYLHISTEDGKRIEIESSSTAIPNHFLSQYNNYQVVEDDEVNLILSGKRWYGDVFGEITNRSYQFVFPNIITSEDVVIKTEIANRSFINEKMALRVNDELNDTIILTSVNPNSTKFAQKKKKTVTYTPNGPEINIDLEYLPSTESSAAWLDYIMVNAISSLNFSNEQLMFRELSSIVEGGITEFKVTNANPQLKVWDVTNPINPRIMESELSATELFFTVSTDSLREFIAFDGSQYLSAEFQGEVANQNLHGEGPFDMVIVTHPLFIEQANHLAGIHEAKDGFVIKITTPEEIYNEFSSGKQDPSAIRDYLKMLYDKYELEEPRFLLLFGDGSFDPKDRLDNNTNLIPTFQTAESWISASSYVIDDYFGYLDDNEGNDAIGVLDIGIGRFPVKTVEEADDVIDKIERYISKGEPQFGEWRTRVCMIADDEDGNLHMEQADSLANGAGFIPKDYNQNKIYLDAYPQVRTPMGHRYPAVTEAINEQIEEGVLIVNYVGHGGKSGWAHERILQTSDIQKWDNHNKLPVFITATCEFSRFDEPELLTGGEMVLLNPNGGGIALFTTTRLAYSQSNFSLNQRLYTSAFVRIDGEMPYLGDLIRLSKPPGQLTTRNFVLLGDPALRMAYPELKANTTKVLVNDQQVSADTIHALDKLSVSGEIVDEMGNRIENFNGWIIPALYDKPTIYTTFGNDNQSYPVEFTNQDKIIWQGKASVTNGVFSFDFIVSKDIASSFGLGKISYYAYSETTDAFGYYNSFTIGGFNENAEIDTEGPELELYMNDLSFVSGDQTIANPVMLAFLKDLHGINTSENGIGHDITAVLDNDNANIINLNDYYEPNVDSYKEGKIEYPFYNLPDGKHTLTLKAWDSYNNSSTKTIEFVINRNAALNINKVYNFPNPFKNKTTFTFDHTRPGDKLDIKLDIYDLAGRLVQTYTNQVTTEFTSLPFLSWDGTDLNGSRLSTGVYIYTLQLTDSSGNVAIKQQKLILSN